jgi:hypothetical protein
MTLRSRRVSRIPRSEYRQLRRESDGSLYDLGERRRISAAEIRDDIRAGRRFRAVRHDTGADCTSEVLAEVLRGALADRVGMGSGLPAGLAAVAGTVLSALDNRSDVTVGSAHRGARARGANTLPAREDEPSTPDTSEDRTR